MNGIQIKVTATPEQIEQMEAQCEVAEALMANTLARRINGMAADDAVPFIMSWFKTVRSMAQANFMTSGIKAEVAPIGMGEPAPIADAHGERMTNVVKALKAAGIPELSQGQLKELWDALK